MANNSKHTYSELVKKRTASDGSYQFEFGASIAREYGIHLKQGKKIAPDGNCVISTMKDQINERYILSGILSFLLKHHYQCKNSGATLCDVIHFYQLTVNS